MKGVITVDGRKLNILTQTAKVAKTGGVVVLVVADANYLPSKEEFPVFEQMCAAQLRELSDALEAKSE